jgi:hypothetical protein
LLWQAPRAAKTFRGSLFALAGQRAFALGFISPREMDPICVKADQLHFKVAGVTDPGVPSRVNQDDFFIWKSPTEANCFAMGMLDGHGRDVGQIASAVASASIQESLSNPEIFAQIRSAPKPAFDQIFKTAHVAIRNVRSHLSLMPVLVLSSWKSP